MTADPAAPLWRAPGGLVGFALSLALHGLAVAAILLLAQWQARPAFEPQVVEIVVEHVAAAPQPEAAPQEQEFPAPQVQGPEPVQEQAAQQDAPPTIEPSPAEPLPAVSLEPAPPPRRKPVAEVPPRPVPAPAAESATRPSVPPAAIVTAPAAPAPLPVEAGAQRYGAILLAWLERYRDYPRAARLRRQEGEVVLRLTVDRAGRLLAAEIAQPSGFALLDQAALDTVRRAAPLPPVPADEPGERLTLLVPVLFALTKG